MFNLTPREQQELALIASGKSTKQVAFALGVSFRTAVSHRYRIFQKLAVHNTAELIVRSVRLGLVEVDGKPEKTTHLTTEQEWREHLNDARSRLQSASERSREAWRQLQSRDLPSPDGSFGYQKALRAESLALAEYRRILGLYTDLVVHGKLPESV
jgi:DNA-binding CsgD family transcriptional regulator